MYRTVPRTRLMLVDIADLAKPKVLDTVIVDGNFVDARLVGGRARVVTSAGVPNLPFVGPTDWSDAGLRAAQEANEEVIRRSTANDWLPKVRGIGENAPERNLLSCNQLSRPSEFSGFETVSVLSLNLAANRLGTNDTVGVVANGQTVYASTTNLYVGTRVTFDTAYTGRLPDEGAPPPPMEQPTYEPRTSLHAFGVATSGPAGYRGSGTVEGALLSQWSLSEHAGHLRVVTTLGTGCGQCNGTEAQLSVLRVPTGQGDLPVIGSVGGMGKGEAVKAVRFMGDRAYVVTFRQVDPFYVVDLSNPARPIVAGELKVPGYSAYLHPVGPGLVLGVGRDATPEGQVTGTKVSLYDVRDASRPTEVQGKALPGAYTNVEHTAKAFLWWEPRRLAVVPVISYGHVIGPDGTLSPGFTGALGLGVESTGITERGRVTQEDGSGVERSAVAGDRLLTVSYSGVRVSDLGSLAARAWVPFPPAS